jgi:hypothetical protein
LTDPWHGAVEGQDRRKAAENFLLPRGFERLAFATPCLEKEKREEPSEYDGEQTDAAHV